MIRPDMTLREVFELMDTLQAACMDVTLDDKNGKPLQGMLFTDGAEVTAMVLGAAKVAKAEWEAMPAPAPRKPSRGIGKGKGK